MPDRSEGLSRRGLLGLGLGKLRPQYLDQLAALDEEARRKREAPARADSDPWAGIDYRPLGRALQPAVRELADFCEVTDQTRALDVAARDGDLAIELARRGAAVTACDSSATFVATGRARAAAADAGVEWQTAGLNRLPFDDASFDLVVSAFGATSAPDVRAVTSELFRLVRPGGLVAVAAWCTAGLMGEVVGALHRAGIYGRDVPRPLAWGRYETVYREFMIHTDDFDAIDGELAIAPTPAALWELLAGSYAPLANHLRIAGPEAAARLRAEVDALARVYAAGRRGAPALPAAYVIDYGRRPA